MSAASEPGPPVPSDPNLPTLRPADPCGPSLHLTGERSDVRASIAMKNSRLCLATCLTAALPKVRPGPSVTPIPITARISMRSPVVPADQTLITALIDAG